MPNLTSQAKYTLHLPSHDDHGNELKDLGTAAHGLLRSQGQITNSRIAPQRYLIGDAPEEHGHALEAFGPDTPETDSHVKEAAKHAAELANKPEIWATKEGTNGVASWMINNKNHQPGAPAHPDAVKTSDI